MSKVKRKKATILQNSYLQQLQFCGKNEKHIDPMQQ